MNEVPHSLTDLEAFCVPRSLYLKPCAKINITIRLPPLKQPGQSISNWDLMEKIKKALLPIQMSSMRVTSSTAEMVRFEAELANRKIMAKVVKALDGYSLKVVGFFEPLKVRAAEAKSDFPTRHDWDEFFRNAKDMDELKAGERPDTIYLAKIPSNWFTDKNGDVVRPSEKVLKQVFEQFGKIRAVDIPVLDRYRKQMPSEISGLRAAGFSFGQDIFFEAYVQFFEYISFLRSMDTLRNMKLVKIMEDDRMFEAAIKVDFDKTKHLSENYIRKREAERERLKNEERKKVVDEERKKKEAEDKKNREELERETRRKQREEKRRLKRLEEKRRVEEEELNSKLADEKRKEIKKSRNVQSRRLLKELFTRIDAKIQSKKSADLVAASKVEPIDDTETLEIRLRQALLREQELRIRKRIEAKMLLKLKERSPKSRHNKNDNGYAHKKRSKTSSDAKNPG